ncbi:FecR domain-containing protein [Leptolyngbya sp. 7M]|uniref:FecR domain-containing protein n=1 Tax=Leptolyngbya sp. 7M TaxID=2812896 RepID=UPI001B8BEE03|nr:FecR domain-containing protein [Leptolyngbya sp. 7M]QYO62774.1 FecR family protein [Leptolyngbya sp. 7M]
MLGKNSFRKILTSLTAVAVLCVYSTVALAFSKDVTAEITVTGQVTVNGITAVSNATVISGSTIVTGPNSSATISLGKNGRIELNADTSMVLNFSGNSVVGILSAGKTRVATATGVPTTITTKDATVIADAGQADVFTVEVECSHTHVDTISGLVTLREGTSDRQIAAGTSEIAGKLEQTGCVVRSGDWPCTARSWASSSAAVTSANMRWGRCGITPLTLQRAHGRHLPC